MQQGIKPIKRSSFLAPLSREHHEDLLLAWKIKEGLRKKVGHERIVHYCLWFYKHHIEDHFKKEERGFAQILGSDHPMMQTMLEDHRAMREMLDKFAEDIQVNQAELEAFAGLINSHVRFEERQLFNYIEKIATKDQLQKLGETLTTEKLPEWKDAFWM